MRWGIENNIDAAVNGGRLRLMEGGLVVPPDFSIDDYAKGPLEYFGRNHDAIRAHQRKGDGAQFPEFNESFAEMRDACEKCHAALARYWKDVIDRVLKYPDWDIMAKYERADHQFKAEQLARENATPKWDSDLYLTKPSGLAIVVRNATSRSELTLVLTPGEAANNARESYCSKLGDFYNLSLPQIAVYSLDAGLLDKIHKAAKDSSIRVLDWNAPSPLW